MIAIGLKGRATVGGEAIYGTSSNMTDKPQFYITTAISYPNGAPHIGHAYEAIATDAIARFMRLDGHDVYFLTGTDEHGIKMLQTAAGRGLTPRELVERNVPRFQAMVERLELLERRFHPHHRGRAITAPRQAIWERMEEAGDIYLDKYAGWYSVRDEAYYDEDETRARRQRPAARAAEARRSNGSRRKAISSGSRPISEKLLELYAADARTSCCRRSA